jgi:flagellar biosynthetic protein FlhB
MAGAQEKTEKPTGKRLAEARKRGNVPKSRDLNASITCLGGGVAVYFSIDLIHHHTAQLVRELWGAGFQAALEANLNRSFFIQISTHFFLMIAPVLAAITILAIGVNLAQVKFLMAWEAIKPSLARLNPLQGMRNLFSLRSLVELGKSIFKLAIVTYVVWIVIRKESQSFFSVVQMDLVDIARITGNVAIKILVYTGILMLFLSVFDYYYQRWQFRKDQMMTKEEVKEEHKQSEGNPQVKSRIRSLQRALARKRMIARVPKADLIITNPTHYAVALAYNKDMEAPKLLAKGRNLIAKRIIRIARKHQIQITQDPPLARALYQQVDVDQQIPVSLYRAVAKVLAYVYQQRQPRL